jgi:hypothetical protein
MSFCFFLAIAIDFSPFPVLRSQRFMWEQRPLALPGLKAIEGLARGVFTAWMLAFWPAY